MRKAEGPSFRSVGSGEGQGRSGKRIRETQVDDTSAGRFPDFSVSGTRPEKKDDERNIGKTVRLSTIFLYIYFMRLLVRRMSLRREAFAGRRRRSSSVPTLPRAFADGERFDRAVRFAPWCRARIDGEAFRCVSGEAVRRVRGERSGRRAVDFRRIVAFEIHGGEFCILFVEMKASKTTFCYEPS